MGPPVDARVQQDRLLGNSRPPSRAWIGTIARVRSGRAFRILFILYCVEAGVFLILAPWTANWDRTLIQLPFGWARDLVLHPFTRGAVSGFGLVHLLWGTHDLELWLAKRRLGRESST